MRTSGVIAACALATFIGAVGCSTDKAATMPASGVDASTRTALHDGMRKLWEDHITWTRMFIISDVAGLPDLDPTVSRLLKNQTDIGTAITPYYGDAAGAELTALLRSHILTAANLLAAAKDGDAPAVQTASASWYANADSIATFLSTANPQNWPLSDMKEMMKDHLDLTLEEALARLHGDYTGDIVAYDKVHDEILRMADMLSEGIISQFPDRVR